MYFDTHAHYDDEKFDFDRDEVIKRVYSEGVLNIVNIGADIESSKRSVDLANKYDFMYAAVGVHPEEVAALPDNYIDILEDLVNNNRQKIVAIGEIGLDYCCSDVPKEVQQKFFIEQIDLPRKVKLPIVIHSRDAQKDTLDIIKSEDIGSIGGILHCFSGSQEMANEVLANGLYIAIGGVVTFKNAKKIVEVIRNVPLDRLLVETDLPYLAPEPFRGKRNESGNLKYIVEKIAEIKNVSPDEVARITTENAKRLYRIN